MVVLVDTGSIKYQYLWHSICLISYGGVILICDSLNLPSGWWQMKESSILVAILVILLAVGCATVPLAPTEEDTARKEFSSPSSGTAGVYIYRNSTYGSAVLKPLHINHIFIGNTAPMTYFYLEVAPGEYTLSTLGEASEVDLNIKLKAGKTYFVRHYIKAGVFSASAGLERVTDEYGKDGVSECNLAEIENADLLASIPYAGTTGVTTSSDTLAITGVNASGNGTTVFDYYGAAEKEVTSNAYDKNLWAIALVEAEGDEQKRKAKYIELRANQLYSESNGTMSDSIPDTQPESDNGQSGTYISDITTNVKNYYFRHKKDRELLINLVQEGNKITGNAGSADSEITGTIEGDTIKFTFWSARVNMGAEVSGEWKVSDDGSRMKGVWRSKQGGTSGTWDLTKIE